MVEVGQGGAGRKDYKATADILGCDRDVQHLDCGDGFPGGIHVSNLSNC